LTAQTENILISVEYAYVLNMLKGTKTAEVRRRPLRIRPGTRVWVYSKLPRGHVELVATADEIVAAPPHKLWNLYQARIAITFAEFKSYFRGIEVGCAILLCDIKPLQPALKLATLRRASANFHPPQFFKRLVAHGPELKSLQSSARTIFQAASVY
jgi:predicted transcriptional regulator